MKIMGSILSTRFRVVFIVFALLSLSELILLQKEASGQMTTSYPRKFSFSGMIELIYKDYNIETNNGYTNKNSYSVLIQRYSLGLKGYIYHPKLVVFTTRLTFTDDKWIKSTSRLKPETRSIIYELQTVFLPYRPVSLMTYTTVSDYTSQGLNGNPYDNRITNLGAILGINLRNLPAIRLEYYHLNITPTGSQINKKETTNDSYHLNIRGTFSSLKTQYSFSAGYTEATTPKKSTDSYFVNAYEKTTFFNKFSIINRFRYFDYSDTKFLGFYSSLEFIRQGRFFHDYHYRYETDESILDNETRKGTLQDIRASYSYRFSSNLFSSLSMTYGLFDEGTGIGEGKYHALSASINYARPIKRHYLVSFYRFFLRDNEQKGKYTEHSGTIEFTLKNYKWGRAYFSYNLTFLNGTFFIQDPQLLEFGIIEKPDKGKYKALSHHLVLVFRGKVLRKASWSAEVQYINSDSTKKRPAYFDYSEDYFESNIIKTEYKKNYYLFLGEVLYPLGIKGTTLLFRTGYSIGQINSIDSKKLFYEVRVNIPASRKLLLASWWREVFYKIERNPNRKTREYQILAEYRWGRIFLSAEYWVHMNEEDSRTREDRRFILKAKRSF